MLGFQISFIHYLFLMFSKDKMSVHVNGSNYIVLLILSVLFVVIAEVAIIADLSSKYGLQDYLSNFSRFRLFAVLQRWMRIGTHYLFKYLFGINKSDADQDVDSNGEFDGLINYILSQTREAIDISEHNILSDIRTLESRLEQQGLLTT